MTKCDCVRRGGVRDDMVCGVTHFIYSCNPLWEIYF